MRITPATSGSMVVHSSRELDSGGSHVHHSSQVPPEIAKPYPLAPVIPGVSYSLLVVLLERPVIDVQFIVLVLKLLEGPKADVQPGRGDTAWPTGRYGPASRRDGPAGRLPVPGPGRVVGSPCGPPAPGGDAAPRLRRGAGKSAAKARTVTWQSGDNITAFPPSITEPALVVSAVMKPRMPGPVHLQDPNGPASFFMITWTRSRISASAEPHPVRGY